MLQTRSSILLVAVTNTAAGGGSAVVVTNSSNIFITNTSLTVMVQNSSGWVFSQSNTAGITVNIINSANWVVNASSTILNSAGWVVSASCTILNSANWNVISAAGTALMGSVSTIAIGTGASTNIINSAGWIFNQANTGGKIILNGGSTSIINTAGWVVGASSTIMNSSRLVTTYDCTYAMDGTAQVVMSYGTINITNSTNTVIVKATSNTRIKVMSLFLISQNTGLLTWQSGSSSGIGLTGPVFLNSNVGYVLPFNPNGWFQTAPDTLLNANLSTPTSIGGCITYLTTS